MEMAERSEESSSGSSWWGSFIDTAKSKSASVLEAVKKDLDELSTAVRTEASNAGAAIAGTLKLDEPDSTANTVKKSLSSFLGQVTEALIPNIEDEDTEAVLITNNGTITLTGFQKHLAELQGKDETYLTEPSDDLAEKYQRWLQVVEQDQFTEQRLAKHLTGSQILNEKYLSLVPDSVPHMEFWKRYLFRRALLEDALANAEKAERRSKQEQNTTDTVSPGVTVIQTEQPKKSTDDKMPSKEIVTPDESEPSSEEQGSSIALKDEIKWESEDFECDVELSEEEQARLLAEYEAEIQEREKRKSLANDPKGKSPKNENKSKAPASKVTPASTKGQKAAPQQKATSQKATTTPKGAGNKKTGTPEGKKQQPKTATDTTAKSDEKLNVEKNHFPKEDASSNSDESWEKEFDLEEQ
ncbi:BSD domain-containing protein 1-A-like [Lutzomyia longipalpis]|uniref:BSD domain-containing protein 1-A-like n=1 Tax=Lutzomyia longipalpis TaxID=7200 RepID=UPI002483426E|nr:BSD domain-containing protein 1-A-like [Lutzomyia longipalpis]